MIYKINSHPISPTQARRFFQMATYFYAQERKRELEKEKIVERLEKAKKFEMPKQLQKDLSAVSERIKATHQKELDLLKKQTKQEFVTKELKDKINSLEKKLSGFVEKAKQRKERFHHLEEKIKARSMTKREKLNELNIHVKNIDKLFRQLQKDKKYSKKKLASIKKTIDSLKNRIKNIKI